MRTTLEFKGVPEAILDKAVKLGLASSRTEAVRLGIFALNKEFNLIKDIEHELVKRKLLKEESEMKKKGLKYLPEKVALAKYR